MSYFPYQHTLKLQNWFVRIIGTCMGNGTQPARMHLAEICFYKLVISVVKTK